MFGGHFYHATMRKSVAVFGTLFNNINVIRKAADGSILNQVKVPLSYGPKEKFLARLDQEHGRNQPVALKLPRMGFEITSLSVDSNQKLSKLNKIIEDHGSNVTKRKAINNYTSYDIGMSLYIMAKSQDDGLQIVEQVLPYFTPDYTVSIKPVDNFDFKQDVPIVLNGVNIQDDYEGDFATRRVLIYQLDFTMKMKFYGPTGDAPIIREVDVDIIDLTQFEEDVAAAIEGGTSLLNSQSFAYTIISADNNNYTFETGANDREGTLENLADPTLNIFNGDTIAITNSLAPNHPLQIENGRGDVVASESGGTLTFTPTTNGTYYYQCTSHAGMRGLIIVTDNYLTQAIDPDAGPIIENINTAVGETDTPDNFTATTTIKDNNARRLSALYNVTVVTTVEGESENQYALNGTNAPDIEFISGYTYTFDQTDLTNVYYPNPNGSTFNQHPILFSDVQEDLQEDQSPDDIAYDEGVSYFIDGAAVTATAYYDQFNTATSRQVQIVITDDTPDLLYYMCINHTGMGGAITLITSTAADEAVVALEQSAEEDGGY